MSEGGGGENKRNFQVFPSRNIFCLNGRAIAGPDRTIYYVTQILIIVPLLIFFARVVPLMVSNLHPVLIAIVCLLILNLIVNFYITAYSDPGIVPRQPKPPEDDNIFQNSRPPMIDVRLGGKLKSVKHCETCQLYRPPRTIHCGICSNCVMNFDHHCPYVGNCVGKRNYKHFLLFVWGTFATLAYVLAVSVFLLYTETVNRFEIGQDENLNLSFWITVSYYPMLFILSAYCFAAIGPVGFLAFFHVYLVSSGQNTNEYLKELYVDHPNPYDRGCFLNFFHSLYPPEYQPFTNYTAPVKETEKERNTKAYPLGMVLEPSNKELEEFEKFKKENGLDEENKKNKNNKNNKNNDDNKNQNRYLSKV